MFTSRMTIIVPMLLAMLAPSSALAQSKQSATSQQARGEYAMVNGLRMYYEVHGGGNAGTPLVLMHGGGSTIESNWGRILPQLRATRRVIAVEFQAHGHTRDVDRPFSFQQDADDVAELLKQLHVARADVLGFSNGGSSALQLAIRHPGVVEHLVIASANYKRDGMMPGFWDFMQKGTFADMPQPLKDAYLKANPSQDGLMAMYKRDSERMLAFKDFPDEDIRAIQAPSLVIDGDKDVVRPEHALALSRLLPHARLCILPGAHGEYLGEISFPHAGERRARSFVSVLEEFLGSDGR